MWAGGQSDPRIEQQHQMVVRSPGVPGDARRDAERTKRGGYWEKISRFEPDGSLNPIHRERRIATFEREGSSVFSQCVVMLFEDRRESDGLDSVVTLNGVYVGRVEAQKPTVVSNDQDFGGVHDARSAGLACCRSLCTSTTE